MEKLIIVLFLFINSILFGQSIAFPKDTVQYYKDIKNNTINGFEFEIVKKNNDSISKIKITADTITKYKIDKIVEEEKFYVIYAKGKASNENEYQYRIKSDKNDFGCKEKIKIGETYQLDLRDYKNHNQRLHFIPGVAFNLVTHSGFSPFDIVIHLDEKLTKDEFNISLNLKGLCLIKEE